MELKGRTNPAVYTKLREHVLTLPLPAKKEHTILMLVMDWHLTSGLASVVAVFDGSASIYLSSGGGFIGGAQKSTTVRAQEADLPQRGDVYFYARTESGLLRAVASEKHLSDAIDPLTALGGAMQNIVTQYRLMQASQAQTPQSN